MELIKRNARLIYHKIRKYLWALKYSKYNKNYNLNLKNEKKIVVVSQSAIHGGAPVLAYHIVEQLKLMGYTVAVVVLEYGNMTEEYCKDNVCYFCLNNRSIKRTALELKNKGFLMCISNSALSGYASKIFSEAGYQVISLVHELPGVLAAMNGMKKAELSLNYSKTVIFPSSVVEKSFLNVITNTKKTKLVIKPQGIYLIPKRLLSKEEARIFIKKKYDIYLDKRVVLNVASVSSRKGFDIFLDMAYKNENINFIWVGVKKNSFYQETLVKHKGRLPRNFFEIGYVNDVETLFAFYSAADIFALTSREEPMGTVVLEAFSAGLPVIAFNNRGGFVDVIRNGENGFLVDTVDADEMLEKIEVFFSENREIHENIRLNCFEKSQSMSFERYVHFIINQFEDYGGNLSE